LKVGKIFDLDLLSEIEVFNIYIEVEATLSSTTSYPKCEKVKR